MNLGKIGEFGLINRFLTRFQAKHHELIIPPGDDCAGIALDEHRLQLVTTDLMVEDVHFRLKTIDPHSLGRKSLAVNISDIAAMGGTPTFCFVSLAIPGSLSTDFLDKLADGMKDICDEHGVIIAGGDTTASQNGLVINICLQGIVSPGNCILRSGAQPGDIVQVSGFLGSSHGGLLLLEKRITHALSHPLLQAHINPVPRVATGKALSVLGVNSMIDISDGLLQDLGHICKASGLGAEIDLDRIPVREELLDFFHGDLDLTRSKALTGGEDYELCWTVSKNLEMEALAAAKNSGAPDACSIGIVTADPGVVVKKHGGPIKFDHEGWNHFTLEDPL